MELLQFITPALILAEGAFRWREFRRIKAKLDDLKGNCVAKSAKFVQTAYRRNTIIRASIKETMVGFIEEHAEQGSSIYTDDAAAYGGLVTMFNR